MLDSRSMYLRVLRFTLTGSFVFLVACSSLPGLGSARQADFDALRGTLKTERLRPRQVRRLAQETLSAEIVRAKDRQDRAFIAGLQGCSGSLTSALSKRAKTRDGVGAEAALLLVEQGRLQGALKKFRNEEDGAWRALSARASRRDGELRRKYFSDDDERVRRAALLAALESKDAQDVSGLLEVARLDPDPLIRNRAYQALGSIGGPRVAEALKDRFATANEEQRLAIVDAWAQPGIYEAGGRGQLARLLTQKQGIEALAASSILARDSNKTLRNLAETRLLWFTEEGTTDERRLALRLLPAHSPRTAQKLVELTKADDAEVAVIAWARLLGNKEKRATAQAALLTMAQEESSTGHQARSALAAAGDERILPLMKKQMQSPSPEARRTAGTALVRLGAFTELSPLLADPEPEVRRPIACRVLARPPLPAD
jgi:HEAT repeat protein